jgi:hypothetical protein
LSFCNITGLERVLEIVVKIILKGDYIEYEKTSKLDGLVERRERLCLKFAKASQKNETMKDVFSLNLVDYHVELRDKEVFHV